MKKFLAVFGILTLAFAAHVANLPTAEAVGEPQPGSLIRGETFPAVYYLGSDGFRYVFPNDKNFFTWYTDFNAVQFISDSQLAKIPIGGNVTYRPGTRMIKIQSDERTYAVGANGLIRHVGSEPVAVALYGSNWNQQIDDVSDAFFSNYTMGDPITDASQFNRDAIRTAASSVNVDKGLVLPAEIELTDAGFVPDTVTIVPGQTVRFRNNTSAKHTATADDLSWGTGTLQNSAQFVRRFEDAGFYTFFDSYDSQNTGTIIVE